MSNHLTEQGESKENKNREQNKISNIFSKKSKPISYIKGDTLCTSEITEEIFSRKSGNFTFTKREISASLDIKKSSNDIMSKINDRIQNEITKNNSSTTAISSNQVRFHNLNGNYNTVSVSNFSNNFHPECWEYLSEKNFIKNEENNSKKRIPTDHMLPSVFSRCKLSLDKPNIYAHSLDSFHPFSFMTGVNKFGKDKNGKLNYPSPVFIDTEEWQVKPDLSKNAILEGMIINDKSGLVLINKDIMKKFKGIISDMISQILKAAFGGPPISLKVILFEPKSILQRITDYWSFAPEFLSKAAKCENALKRMKLVITFAISGFYIPTKQLKPFNPLIGETFQGKFENGDKIYVEHISHYPTIARFLMIGNDYKFHGYFDFSTDQESFGSRINIHQRGPITVEFTKLNEEIIYNMPTVKLLNASSEEGRSAIWVNTMLFSDIKNNLKAVLKFGTNSDFIHGFEGYILDHKWEIKNKYEHKIYLDQVSKCKLDNEYDKIKKNILSRVSGSWLHEIKFDDKEIIWNIDKFSPAFIKPLTNVLPSDGRFREDLIWLYRFFNAKTDIERKTFLDFSQGWKVTIESSQRSEREIKKKTKLKLKK